MRSLAAKASTILRWLGERAEMDPVSFYGVNNCNMQLIRNLFPKLRMAARGSVIKVIGEDAETAEFEKNDQDQTVGFGGDEVAETAFLVDDSEIVHLVVGLEHSAVVWSAYLL